MSIFSFGGSSSNKNHKQIVDDLTTLPSEPNGADQFQLLNKIEIKNADKLITEGILKQLLLLLKNKKKIKTKAHKKLIDLILEFASIEKYKEKFGNDEQACTIVMNELIKSLITIEKINKKKQQEDDKQVKRKSSWKKVKKKTFVKSDGKMIRFGGFFNSGTNNNKKSTKVAPAAFGGTNTNDDDDDDG